MTKLRVRQTIHRGSVLASGLAIDTRLVSETTARRRIFELSSMVLRLFRVETQLLVIFRQPIRMTCLEAMGAPLVRQGRLLTSAPLDADEHAALQSALDAVVLVEGGEPTARILDELVEEDISSWIDLSPFLALSEVHSLGAVVFEPKAALTELKTDVRQSLGVTPLTGEAHQAIQSLTHTGSSNKAQLDARSAIESIADIAGSILTGLWRSINTLLRRPRYGNPSASPAPALAEVNEAAVQGESWFSKVRNALWRLAAQALLRSRLASLVGRRHAEYLARVLDMFDSNQLDDALRHAIPLNSEVEAALRPPAFRTPSPRTSLAIVPGRAGASTSLGLGEDLFEGLRRRYRRAFDRLADRGEIEKAAFVLTELLNSNEEAVSFLEKHNRLRQAAEIAEARKLPPGLVIRLWFLAKDRARAIRIARRTGAFADAVVRLEKTHQHEAHALRLLWADTLASSGAYAAAVDAVWPVTDARNLALRWLDNAIEVGGVTGARMLARKARFLPAAFPEIRASVLGLLQDQGVQLPVLQALAEALSAGEATPETRILAKATARRLLGHSGNPDIDRLIQRLLDVSGDAALRADARASRLTKDPKHHRWSRIRMQAFALTHQGVHRTVNEDTSAISFLDAGSVPKKQGAIDGNPATKGMVLAVFDGASDWGPEGSVMVSQLAATTVVERLRAEFSTSGAEPGQWARALAISLEQANRQLFEAPAHQCGLRGMTSATVATVCHGKLFIAQLGITRGYVLRGHALVQVTRDHSLLNEHMGDEAQMTEENVAGFSYKTVTRMMGAAEKAAADISQVELEHGDVVLLCSDGLWSLVEEERIRRALVEHRNPQGACNALLSMALEAGLPDDISVVVAKFEGMGLPRAGKAVVSSPFVPPTIEGKDTRNATPLASRPVALEISRSAADSGAMKVFDAAELPDGRMLVALGEVGVFLLSREGSVLTRFAEPANRLVISDHGDRALLMAPRGEAYRVARLDLMAKRVRHWCDARFHQFAADFDGLTWFVAQGGTVYAIDTAADGWEHQWKVGERGATVGAIQRDSQRACIWFEYAETNGQIWTFELPSLTLRQRRPIRNGRARFNRGAIAAGGNFVGWRTDTENPSAHAFVHSVWKDLALTSTALPEAPFATDDWMVVPVIRPEGASLHLFDSSSCRERARIDLEGAGRDVGVRFQGDHLTVFDGRGRVLVISLRSGEVIREHRIS